MGWQAGTGWGAGLRPLRPSAAACFAGSGALRAASPRPRPSCERDHRLKRQSHVPNGRLAASVGLPWWETIGPSIGYGGLMNRRAVATGLLIALLAVFAMVTPIHHEPGTMSPHTVVSTAAPTLPSPNTTPELPLAGAETTLHPPVTPRLVHVEAEPDAHPRAHREPAAGRAPPARV